MTFDNLAYEHKQRDKAITHDFRPIAEKRRAKEKKRSQLKVTLFIICFIVGGISLIFNNAQITEQSKKNTALKAEYAELYSANKKKEVEINQKMDLKTVEELAIASYGMNRARSEQIVYIDVPDQDYGVMAKATDTSDSSDDNFGIQNGMIAYLDE
ncbi:MAG: hypothetical protein E7413_03975 [Ruminococcaceae bacterium]|nr:hypothetical protein [Oscillospiraceae bacterium]